MSKGDPSKAFLNGKRVLLVNAVVGSTGIKNLNFRRGRMASIIGFRQGTATNLREVFVRENSALSLERMVTAFYGNKRYRY